jgi:phosphatidylinositol glycan class A protein
MDKLYSNKQSLNICMVCDFFYPRLGGVEMHIFQLALCLIERGHKVIVVTHCYNNRSGVRYITNGLKVYYLPIQEFVDTTSWPALFGMAPLFRKIWIRERIDIVHSHQATSVLGLEAILHSRTMGYKTVYTDHSLFGFSDAACIHINKVLKWYLSDIDACVSVSHASRENLCLRASLNPNIISVIPNAVDTSRFRPDPSKRFPLNTINIVFIARLTYRKGVDLLADVIPPICKKYPEAHFIVGGDGPKKKLLQRIIEENNLQGRVELLGSLPHKEVRNVLVRGHIFLNTSLTEAFCIAIVEAAAAGLLVVSTKVGGVSEVLPKEFLFMADTNGEDIIRKVDEAIPLSKNIPSQKIHDCIANMYSWKDVAARTEIVYQSIIKKQRPTLLERIKRYYSSGPYAGLCFIGLVVLDLLFLAILCVLCPASTIERAMDFPYKEYIENKEKYGDHKFNILPKKK